MNLDLFDSDSRVNQHGVYMWGFDEVISREDGGYSYRIRLARQRDGTWVVGYRVAMPNHTGVNGPVSAPNIAAMERGQRRANVEKLKGRVQRGTILGVGDER